MQTAKAEAEAKTTNKTKSMMSANVQHDPCCEPFDRALLATIARRSARAMHGIGCCVRRAFRATLHSSSTGRRGHRDKQRRQDLDAAEANFEKDLQAAVQGAEAKHRSALEEALKSHEAEFGVRAQKQSVNASGNHYATC